MTVSVIVPIYNVEKYLPRCIDSLLNQDKQPYEIILVDDGSPDGSGAICDSYAARYDNIKVVHKQNGGLSSARLAGFNVATGELIAFVDSDDYVSSTYLSELSAPFVNDDVDLSMCGYYSVQNGVLTEFKLPYKADCIENNQVPRHYLLAFIGNLSDSDKINVPGFVPIRMYRRSLLCAGDFVSERKFFLEDVLMNLLYGKRIKGKIAIIDAPLYYYCVNPGSLTLKYRPKAFEMLIACNIKCAELTADLDVEKHERQARLDANLVAATTYSVYNIGRIRQYTEFKKQIKTVFSHQGVQRLFDDGLWPRRATWHKIICAAYHTRAYFMLYLLLKTRKVL